MTTVVDDALDAVVQAQKSERRNTKLTFAPSLTRLPTANRPPPPRSKASWTPPATALTTFALPSACGSSACVAQGH